METYTAYLFAALVIVGGVIAWLGDVIGARLGKKRKTLFGLRPRQSARLVAVIIGGLLPLTGLLVATVGSDYARKAVFEMHSLLRSVDDLKTQVTDYKQQAEQSREAADQARADAEHSAELLVGAEELVENLTDQQESLTGQVAGLQGEVAQGERAVAQARGDVTQAKTNLGKAESELSEAETLLGEVEGRKDLAENHLQLIHDRVASAQRAVENAKRTVEDAQENLADLQDDLAETQEQLDELKYRDRLITGQPAVFDVGDELTLRFEMDAAETQDQTESALFEMLYWASGKAQTREVPEGPNGRAVVVVAPTPMAVAPGEHVPEALIVRHVASVLRTQGAEQWVVWVSAFRRIFPGDDAQLEVRFWAAPNVKVFDKGEVLAEMSAKADAETSQLFEDIYRIITDREGPVRVMAMGRGMLPDANTGNYGVVRLSQIFDATAEIREREGNVPVRIVATDDTYTVGPLLIELQVGEEVPTP